MVTTSSIRALITIAKSTFTFTAIDTFIGLSPRKVAAVALRDHVNAGCVSRLLIITSIRYYLNIIWWVIICRTTVHRAMYQGRN